jgi:hypothetical protein
MLVVDDRSARVSAMASEAPDAAIAPRRSRWPRLLAGLAIALIAAMWLYAWLPFPRPRPADVLDDGGFAAAAEPMCAATIAELQRLPLVTQDSPPDQLAAVVARANDELRAMLTELESLPRPDGRDGELLGQFLADWHVHLADRDAWVDRLRSGDDGPFTETVIRNGDGASGYLAEFAQVNDMASCGAPTYGG